MCANILGNYKMFTNDLG
jgi:hypothetical protein